MISEAQFNKEIDIIIANAIREDVGDGDHSSLACIPKEAQGKAKLLVKDNGVIAGVEFAKKVFKYVDKDLKVKTFINDGRSACFSSPVAFLPSPPPSLPSSVSAFPSCIVFLLLLSHVQLP